MLKASSINLEVHLLFFFNFPGRHNKGRLIRATFSCNLSGNNVALQVEIVCFA